MTAFQSMMLLSCGAPLMPAGGSCCSRLKSRIRRFLAGVDISASQSQTLAQAPISRVPQAAARAREASFARLRSLGLPSPTLLVRDARGEKLRSERRAGGGGRSRVRKGVVRITDAERERRDVTWPLPPERPSSRYPTRASPPE